MMFVDNKSISALSTKELCQLLGISKTTLFSHEKRVSLAPNRNDRNARQYNEYDVLIIMRSLADAMSGNPEYPDSLVPMHPRVAELDLNSPDLTLGLLHIIAEASK